MTARDHVDAYEGECLREFPAAEIREGRVVAPKAFVALRAVLDLHGPYTGPGADDAEPVCGGCIHDPEDRDEDGVPWPCPTVAAITTALEAS